MPSNTSGEVLVDGPSFPQNRGIWLILLAPVVFEWVASPPSVMPAVFLVICLLSAVMARHTAVLILDSRAPADGRFWLGLELVAFGITGMSLVLSYHSRSLLVLGAIGTGLFGLGHALRSGLGNRWVFGRSASEALRVATLVLSGPAAYAVSHGGLGTGAWVLFAGSWLLFWGASDLVPGGLDATSAHRAVRSAERSV